MSIGYIVKQVAYIQQNFSEVLSTKKGVDCLQKLFDRALMTPIPLDDRMMISSLRDRVTPENLDQVAQILLRNQMEVETHSSSLDIDQWLNERQSSETKRRCLEPKETNAQPHLYHPKPSFYNLGSQAGNLNPLTFQNQPDENRLKPPSSNKLSITLYPRNSKARLIPQWVTNLDLDRSWYKEQTDPQTAKMTAVILNSDGFVKEDARDRNYELKDNQTIAEVQGSSSFCKKVIQYAVQTPSVLSPAHLRDQENVNRTLSYILRIKRLGHALNIEKMIDVNGTRANTAGFNETFMVPMLRDAFDKFASFQKNLITEEMRALISTAVSKAIWHDNASDEKINEIYELIHNPANPYPVAISSGWTWHSTQLIFDGDYLYYCNRGADCNKKPGIVVLKMNKKENITREFIKRITSRLSVTHGEYTSLAKIEKELDTEPVINIPMKSQKTGNCVYASEKAKYLALFVIAVSRENLKMNGISGAPSAPLPSHIDRAKLNFYKKFSQFDKELVIADHIKDLGPSRPKKNDPYARGLNIVADFVKDWIIKQEVKNTINEQLRNEVLRLHLAR